MAHMNGDRNLYDWSSGDKNEGAYKQHQEEQGDAVQDVYFLNSMNNTQVAAWDLQDPDPKDGSQGSRPRHTESLGMGGDRRAQVARAHIQPGGKYRAICKLFMGFSRNKDFAYMGTGWLLTNSIVVTAGHCLYDSRGGYLKSIKVYIGYEGPEDTALTRNGCQMRMGRIASIPSEYIKTAHTIHDIGFIELGRPFDGVEPFQPQDSPESSSGMELGVVGYPGDLEYGNYMYEHWDTTQFDLRKNGFLSYNIDTEAGESGSPILRRVPDTGKAVPIGIHTDGGYPNSGSVLGPLGNLLTDYTTALKIKRTKKLMPGSTTRPVPGIKDVRNLEYITIPASMDRPVSAIPFGSVRQPGQESAPVKPRPHPYGEQGVTDRRTEAMQALKDLEQRDQAGSLGQGQRYTEAARAVSDLESVGNPKPGKSRKELTAVRSPFIKAVYDHLGNGGFRLPNVQPVTTHETAPVRKAEMHTRTPKSLPRGAYKESGTVTSDSQDELVKQALARVESSKDIKTTFFIDFPPELEGQALTKLQRIQNNVLMWQSWASSLTAAKVQEQINDKNLPDGTDASSQARRLTYSNMVFDHIMRASTWMVKTYDEVQNRHIKCTKLQLHTKLITDILDGFSVPGSVASSLHKVLDSISNGIIEFSKQKTSQSVQYFIMLTRYEYHNVSKMVQPVIRVISFRTDITVNEFAQNKVNYQEIDLKFSYNQYQCDFNDEVFDQIRQSFNKTLVDRGEVLRKMTVSEMRIPVPPMSTEAMAMPRPSPRESRKQSAPIDSEAATYQKLVEKLGDLSQGEESSEIMNDELEIFDAGVATLIGTRLALEGHYLQEKKFVTLDLAATQFPRYWQRIGSFVFMQLFPKLPFPSTLRFYDDEKKLKDKIDQLEKEALQKQNINESLEFHLHRARKDAESQAGNINSQNAKIEELTNALNTVTALGPAPVMLEELKNIKLQNEKLEDEKAAALQESQTAKTSEAATRVDLSNQKKQNETLNDSLKEKSSSIDKLIRRFDPSLRQRDSGVVDISSSIVPASATTTSELKEPVKFDVELLKCPNLLVGMSALKSDLAVPNVQVYYESQTSVGFTLRHARNAVLSEFKASWLAILENDSLKSDNANCDLHSDTGAQNFTTTFTKAFFNTPIVHVFLKRVVFKSTRQINSKLQMEVNSMDLNKCTWTATYDHPSIEHISVGWIAYDPTTTARTIKSGYIVDKKDSEASQTITFEGSAFAHRPSVFVAVCSLPANTSGKLFFKAEVTEVKKDSVTVSVDRDRTADDPGEMKFLWIAVD